MAAMGKREQPAPDDGPPVISVRDDNLDEHLAEVLERLEVDCVIDVGANYGQYRGLLRRLGFGGRIVSFEPVLKCFEHCAALAAGDESWHVHRLALGPRRGTKTIRVTSSEDFSSFLRPNAYSRRVFDDLYVAHEERVPVATLDALWPDLVGDGHRVFLKTDTQGWDIQVLKGARRRLREVRGIQCEVAVQRIYAGMPGYHRSLAYLEWRGFRLTGLYPVWRDPQLRIGELDCVVVRPELMGGAA